MKQPTPEQEVKAVLTKLFNCRNLSEVARRTGYPQSTLSAWRRKPESIKAVDLIRLRRELE